MRHASGSHCLILKGQGRVYKVPLSFRARRLLRQECEANWRARQDSFWNEWVLPLNCGVVTASSTTAQPLDAKSSPLIKRFIERRRVSINDATKTTLNTLVDSDRLIDLCRVSQQARLKLFLRDYPVPCQSVHGDMHRGNMVVAQGRLRFIDWVNYRQKFWAPYDLLHLSLCTLAVAESLSWVDLVAGPRVKPMDLDTLELAVYVVSRVDMELAQDLRLGRLSGSRVEKYRNALDVAVAHAPRI